MRDEAQADNAVDSRPKNFLTQAETASFLQAARKGRHGVRNYAMAVLAYRHGLRVSELINMRMVDVDLDTGHVFVHRVKGSLSTSHPLGATKSVPCDDGYGSESTLPAAIHRSCFCRSVVR